ncbi:MAG: hypothetical protein ACRDXX_15275 [Stackebrandtia sp.]
MAAALALVGTVVIFATGGDFGRGGDFDGEAIGDLCESVDVSALEDLEKPALAEDERSGDSESDDSLAEFSCEVRLLAEEKEESSDYLAVTVRVKAQIAKTVNRAEDVFAGAVDYEESEGRKVDAADVGDDSVTAADPEQESADQREYRSHVRSSNAVVSVTMIVSSSAMDAEVAGAVPPDVAESTLEVMRSE